MVVQYSFMESSFIPTGSQAKIRDGPKRENGVKNVMFASKIDVQAAEEYDGK